MLDHTLDETMGHAPSARTSAGPARHSAAGTLDAVGTAGTTDAELIGRHVERSAMDAWHATANEIAPLVAPSVMVIDGEAGIGKTALFDAWIDGRMAGGRVVRTRCSPEQILPFEAFGGLLTDDTDMAVGPGSADDGRTQEAAERLFPTSRHLQFDEVVQRLVDRQNPVQLLAIDDAQWMTVASVALLRHVLWHPGVGSLRVLLTVRTPDVAANAALTQLLNDLERADRSTTLRLRPFDPDELDELIARHSSGPTPRTRSASLLRLTGGNPLFAVQMLRSSRGDVDLEAAGVPPTVESVLGRYLTPLSLATRRIVETAALLGAGGTPSRLAACAGVSELEAMDALDEVGEGRLVQVEPVGGAYHFVHDLARRTVMAGIGPARVASMHVAIAEALEGEHRPDVFAVAHHLSVGRVLRRRPRWCRPCCTPLVGPAT